MGAQEETGALALAAAVVVKGKRSKRRRVAVIAAAESSSAATEGSTSRSGVDEAASTGCVTEEEEDMALCLMLLARGGRGLADPAGGAGASSPSGEDGDCSASVEGVAAAKEAKFRSRRPVDGAAGEFVYECKTCSKRFPSFQALGGHRTSHKKPRLVPPLPPATPPEDRKVAVVAETSTSEEKPKPSPSLPLPPPPPPPAQARPAADPTVLAARVIPKQEVLEASAAAATSSSKQARVHECSICGAEFSSGQALGGHMRRHRPLVPASAAALDDGPRKEKSLLELDLNMPAPCEDGEASATSPAAFAFAVKERARLLFPASTSALVDCHY